MNALSLSLLKSSRFSNSLHKIGVLDIGGPRAIDHAWVAPENLPVLAELDDPASWLVRVQKLHAAGL